ncbi:MAG: hypothetical protein WA642_01825 [Steroidobacteraceae bacterium]
MQEYLKDRLWVHLRRATMAVLASGAVASMTPPALAQQTGEAVAGGANDAPPARNYPIDTLTAYELSRLFDVKQVRAELTKGATGSPFMLTDSGPYVIRLPGVEFILP